MPRSHEAHERLCRLARAQAVLDVDLGEALLAAYRERVYVPLGLGSFGEYVERTLGWSRRQTEERLRVAMALESLPVLRAALSEGVLSWSAVREITRIATAETETEWLDESKGRTVRSEERRVGKE